MPPPSGSQDQTCYFLRSSSGFGLRQENPQSLPGYSPSSLMIVDVLNSSKVLGSYFSPTTYPLHSPIYQDHPKPPATRPLIEVHCVASAHYVPKPFFAPSASNVCLELAGPSNVVPFSVCSCVLVRISSIGADKELPGAK